MKLYWALILLLCACASTTPVKPRNLWADFRQVMEQKNWPVADRYAIYLATKTAPTATDSLVLAQYFLSRCQLHAAWNKVLALDTVTTKSWQAIIAGMAATPRPAKPAAQPEPDTAYISSARDGEIWQDEWSELRLPQDFCTSFPISVNKDNRTALARFSAEQFSQLPQEIFQKDFSLVAVALDVGFTPPLSAMQNYVSFQQNDYYKEWLYRLGITLAPAQDKDIKLKSQTANKVQLDTMELILNDFSPREISIPWLL